MATTYGYAGEFSSDEDIDRMEQQTERLAQSKFDAYSQAKPSKEQIEDVIASIRSLPADQDVIISDDHLAALLDYYKTTRGPIVDSTRVLYKKIVLRLIRTDQHQAATNGDSQENNLTTAGTTNNNNNNNNNNLGRAKQANNEIPSSDEDEPMPPASSQSSTEQARRKFDSRVVYNEDKIEPMEIDSDVPLAQIRHPKQVDISSSESDSETEESSDESSGSEVLDVTPIKPPAQYVHKDTPAPAPNQVSRSVEVAKKPVAASTPKEAITEPKRKPYTRSQRIAANRASSTPKKTESALSKSDGDLGSQSARATTFISQLKLEEPDEEHQGENGGRSGDILLSMKVSGMKAIHGRKLNYAEKMVLTAMIKKQEQRVKPKDRRKSSDH